MDGQRLDELESAEERGKLPYQKLLLIIGCAIFGAICGYITMVLTK